MCQVEYVFFPRCAHQKTIIKDSCERATFVTRPNINTELAGKMVSETGIKSTSTPHKRMLKRKKRSPKKGKIAPVASAQEHTSSGIPNYDNLWREHYPLPPRVRTRTKSQDVFLAGQAAWQATPNSIARSTSLPCITAGEEMGRMLAARRKEGNPASKEPDNKGANDAGIDALPTPANKQPTCGQVPNSNGVVSVEEIHSQEQLGSLNEQLRQDLGYEEGNEVFLAQENAATQQVQKSHIKSGLLSRPRGLRIDANLRQVFSGFEISPDQNSYFTEPFPNFEDSLLNFPESAGPSEHDTRSEGRTNNAPTSLGIFTGADDEDFAPLLPHERIQATLRVSLRPARSMNTHNSGEDTLYLNSLDGINVPIQVLRVESQTSSDNMDSSLLRAYRSKPADSGDCVGSPDDDSKRLDAPRPYRNSDLTRQEPVNSGSSLDQAEPALLWSKIHLRGETDSGIVDESDEPINGCEEPRQRSVARMRETNRDGTCGAQKAAVAGARIDPASTELSVLVQGEALQLAADEGFTTVKPRKKVRFQMKVQRLAQGTDELRGRKSSAASRTARIDFSKVNFSELTRKRVPASSRGVAKPPFRSEAAPEIKVPAAPMQFLGQSECIGLPPAEEGLLSPSLRQHLGPSVLLLDWSDIASTNSSIHSFKTAPESAETSPFPSRNPSPSPGSRPAGKVLLDMDDSGSSTSDRLSDEVYSDCYDHFSPNPIVAGTRGKVMETPENGEGRAGSTGKEMTKAMKKEEYQSGFMKSPKKVSTCEVSIGSGIKLMSALPGEESTRMCIKHNTANGDTLSTVRDWYLPNQQAAHSNEPGDISSLGKPARSTLTNESIESEDEDPSDNATCAAKLAEARRGKKRATSFDNDELESCHDVIVTMNETITKTQGTADTAANEADEQGVNVRHQTANRKFQPLHIAIKSPESNRRPKGQENTQRFRRNKLQQNVTGYLSNVDVSPQGTEESYANPGCGPSQSQSGLPAQSLFQHGLGNSIVSGVISPFGDLAYPTVNLASSYTTPPTMLAPANLTMRTPFTSDSPNLKAHGQQPAMWLDFYGETHSRKPAYPKYYMVNNVWVPIPASQRVLPPSWTDEEVSIQAENRSRLPRSRRSMGPSGKKAPENIDHLRGSASTQMEGFCRQTQNRVPTQPTQPVLHTSRGPSTPTMQGGLRRSEPHVPSEEIIGFIPCGNYTIVSASENFLMKCPDCDPDTHYGKQGVPEG